MVAYEFSALCPWPLSQRALLLLNIPANTYSESCHFVFVTTGWKTQGIHEHTEGCQNGFPSEGKKVRITNSKQSGTAK